MSKDLKEFDKFKRELGKRWSKISVYNTTEMLILVIDGFRPYIFSLLNIGLDVDDHLNNAIGQIKNEFLCFKINERNKNKEKSKKILENFLAGEL